MVFLITSPAGGRKRLIYTVLRHHLGRRTFALLNNLWLTREKNINNWNESKKSRHCLYTGTYSMLCTYRKHFEDLEPIGCPALLGFVDGQRKVNISGILREEQHQEDSPAERTNPPKFSGDMLYRIFSAWQPILQTYSFKSCLCLTRTPEA